MNEGVKLKRKYKVYLVRDTCCNGQKSQTKSFIGETYAVSKQKAESNVRFRMYGRKYADNCFDLGCDDYANEYFEAIEV